MNFREYKSASRSSHWPSALIMCITLLLPSLISRASKATEVSIDKQLTAATRPLNV